MKKIFVISILISFLGIGFFGFNFQKNSLAQELRSLLKPAPILPGAETPKVEYAPGEVLVKFKTGTPPEEIEGLFQEFEVSKINKIKKLEIHHLGIPASFTVLEMVEKFKKNPLIKFAEPNYRRYKMVIPDDPYYSQQWALNQANDHDIDAQQGWDLETGSASVIIAIIDDGIDYNHEEFLSGKLWINPTTNEPGWDFGGTCEVCTPSGSKKCTPDDDVMHESGSGHGTAVAGIAAATTNNAKGIAGTSWGPVIMPLKTEDSCGNIYDSYIAEAIEFAADNGADVISMSLGGPIDSSTIRDACDYAWTTEGKVVLASSGNEGGAIGYPAAYSTTIAVGATTEYDWRAGWSNFGPELDVVAPGTNIYTPDWSASGEGYDPGSYYSGFGGTSASCPFAAGMAALLISHDPSLTNTQVRDFIRATAEDQIGNPAEDTAGFDNYYGYGRINIDAALCSLDNLVDGTGKAEASPYFIKTGITIDLTLNLKAEVTTPIIQWEVTVPSSWSWGQNSADIINLTGGCSGATKSVVGNVITLTNCDVDRDGTYPTASFAIKNITPPSTGGIYTFSGRTAGSGGSLTAIDSDENAKVKVMVQKGTYDVFVVLDYGTGPDASTMAGYDIVVWETGDTYNDETLLSADRTAIGSYLDGGGKMFISGSGVAYDLESGTDQDATWEQNYLGTDYLGDQTDFGVGLTGQNETVGEELASIPYFDRGTGAYSTHIAGVATAVGSTVNFRNTRYVPSDQNIGFEKTNVVFLSFEYEGLGTRQDRADLMENIINHLNSAAIKILLVDDDRGFDNRETYYTRALEDNGYFLPAVVSISLTTNGLVEFGTVALGAMVDSSGDVETIRVDTGPANLDVKSTIFSDNGNSWSLGLTNGANEVKWEFSTDGNNWTIFEVAGNTYSLGVNPHNTGTTQNLYLQLTMPTYTASTNQYSSTVTIVATAP